MLHFTVPPEVLRPLVPEPLELELWEGKAWVSLVAVSMRNFRGCGRLGVGSLFEWVGCRRFLNFRTYARQGEERGALFLHGWLSGEGKPPPMVVRAGIGVLSSGLFRLPCSAGVAKYEHDFEAGVFEGEVNGKGAFKYSGRFGTKKGMGRVRPEGPVGREEFLMERYSGWFEQKGRVWVFRIWHPEWEWQAAEAEVEDCSLVTGKFPWFEQARFAGAQVSPGFRGVEMGRARVVRK